MENNCLIIWDWDNTLADTRMAVKAGLQDVADFYGLPPITDRDVLNVMTSHRGLFWQKNFGENVPEAIEYYVKSYRTHGNLVKLFPDTKQALDYVRVKHIPQIVLSNKHEGALLEEVERQGVASYFARIQGTTGPLGKPDKAFTAPILDQFKPKKVILIGDGISDMLMARNMGARSILVHQPDKTLPHEFDCETLTSVCQIIDTVLNNEVE